MCDKAPCKHVDTFVDIEAAMVSKLNAIRKARLDRLKAAEADVIANWRTIRRRMTEQY